MKQLDWLSEQSSPLPNLMIPLELIVSQINQRFNYPNPFSKSTTVAYTLEQRTYLRLILINSQGVEVRMLLNRLAEAGQHKIILLSEELPCVLYFLQAQTVDGTIWHKMIIQLPVPSCRKSVSCGKELITLSCISCLNASSRLDFDCCNFPMKIVLDAKPA